MSRTISSELLITDQKAEEILEIAKSKLKEKDFVHEILQDFVCSDFTTSELVFASYVLGAMMGGMRAEKSSKIDSNEMDKLMLLMKFLSK